MKKLFSISLLLLLMVAVKGYSQPVITIGLTDSATFMTKWSTEKTMRVMKTGVTNMYLERVADGLKDWSSEIGSTGYYQFDSVGSNPGFYTLWVEGVERLEYGTRQIASFMERGVDDTSFVHTSGSSESAWVTNMYWYAQHQFYNYCPASLVAPTIASHLTQKQYVDHIDTSNTSTSGTEANYATLTFHGTIAFVNASNPPGCSTAPTSANHLTNKTYVDDLVATIVVTPFQESSNRVRYIPNGTIETGKVYNTITGAVSYFSSESASNPCYVEIFPYSSDVTISHSELSDYVHFYSSFYSSENKTDPIVILGCATASVTKTDVRFEGLTLLMGANVITGDRTYNGFTFKDCTIFAFKNTTFTNCILSNSTIYHASGYSATYDGSTQIYDCRFNQYTTEGGSWTGWISKMSDGFKTNYSMPTDVSTACTD